MLTMQLERAMRLLSLCERQLPTLLIFALTSVKRDKSIFFSLHDSEARSTHTIASVEGQFLQKSLQPDQMLNAES